MLRWLLTAGACDQLREGVRLKIGIVTIFKADNYGAELQAYALQRKLDLMGHDSELIDYPFYKHRSYVKCQMSRPLFDIGLANKLKERVYPTLQGMRGLPTYRARVRRRRRMEDFHKKHTRLTTETFVSMEALYAAMHPYDVFMVGSDQVWNPRMNSSLDPYFLTFAPPGKRRVSYASSFGVSELPVSVKQVYANRLDAFSSLAVRERQGVDIIRGLLGRSAEQVLDPTLLLESDVWADVAIIPAASEPYVLLYELMRCPGISVVGRRVASQIKNAKIVRLGGGYCRSANGILNVTDAGPSEFIGLFQNAAAVVTNSFHGTAFAVNFQKPFYSVIPARMKNAGRISSLLELTGLTDRLIAEGDEHSCLISPDMDFSDAQVRLDQAREASRRYLERAVTGQL